MTTPTQDLLAKLQQRLDQYEASHLVLGSPTWAHARYYFGVVQEQLKALLAEQEGK